MSDWDDDEGAFLAERADRILAQTTALLAQRGDEQAVALLIDVRTMEFVNTDEVAYTYRDAVWGEMTHTVYLQTAMLDVDDHLVSRFADSICERIAETLVYVAERNNVPDVKYVGARPALPDVDKEWRQTYAARLSAERPTNQARRERGLAQHPTQDGLTFGSTEELRVYRSLRRLQDRAAQEDTIAIIPLPGARLRPNHTWSPDFLVAGRGRALVIEVDGPHHRTVLRRADDGNRDLQWRRCGVPVVRLPVEDLKDDAALDARIGEELRRHLPRRA
jgi:hypothetical protein